MLTGPFSLSSPSMLHPNNSCPVFPLSWSTFPCLKRQIGSPRHTSKTLCRLKRLIRWHSSKNKLLIYSLKKKRKKSLPGKKGKKKQKKKKQPRRWKQVGCCQKFYPFPPSCAQHVNETSVLDLVYQTCAWQNIRGRDSFDGTGFSWFSFPTTFWPRN